MTRAIPWLIGVKLRVIDAALGPNQLLLDLRHNLPTLLCGYIKPLGGPVLAEVWISRASGAPESAESSGTASGAGGSAFPRSRTSARVSTITGVSANRARV